MNPVAIPRGLDRDPHIQVEPASAGAAVVADDPSPTVAADGAGGAPAPAEPDPDPARKPQTNRLPRYGAAVTEQELRVLEQIAQGLTNAEAGQRLYLSEHTVKTHLRRLFAKLGARGRAHAVTLGYKRGLLLLPQPPTPLSERHLITCPALRTVPCSCRPRAMAGAGGDTRG